MEISYFVETQDNMIGEGSTLETLIQDATKFLLEHRQPTFIRIHFQWSYGEYELQIPFTLECPE